MSSGSPWEQGGAWHAANAVADAFRRAGRYGLSPRQRTLNWYWAHYRCSQYDNRRVDWDGREVLDRVDHEAASSQTFLPPGYASVSPDMPLKFRRPSAPYPLSRSIVDRFTGLLFSERRHPRIQVEGRPAAESYVAALVDACRLWPAMMLARAHGGSMGTAVIGFKFVDGCPRTEVHDPRWCRPVFRDRTAAELESVEIRYMYPVEEWDVRDQVWRQVPYWYRRVIGPSDDVEFEPVSVELTSKLKRDEDIRWTPARTWVHGFGFCPVVWIQNVPVQDDVDGDPDAHGAFDLIERIDMLLSQADRGVMRNCDPAVVIKAASVEEPLKKGSDNALLVGADGDAKYLELLGTGPKAAQDLARYFRALALEVTSCVLENPNLGDRATATEVEKGFSAMLAKAGVLREQYGERGIVPFIGKMLEAIRALDSRRGMAGERLAAVRIPGLPEGAEFPEDGMRIRLRWPGYFEASATDAKQAADAVQSARAAGVLDVEAGVHFVADAFRVEDRAAMLDRIREEREREQRDADAAAIRELERRGVAAQPPDPADENDDKGAATAAEGEA